MYPSKIGENVSIFLKCGKSQTQRLSTENVQVTPALHTRRLYSYDGEVADKFWRALDCLMHVLPSWLVVA
jgi:hypothetical protein